MRRAWLKDGRWRVEETESPAGSTSSNSAHPPQWLRKGRNRPIRECHTTPSNRSSTNGEAASHPAHPGRREANQWLEGATRA